MTAAVLGTALDPRSAGYQANRATMLDLLAEIEEAQRAALASGTAYVERHRSRGKLLARERIDLLLDASSPFLELSPLAAYGTADPAGAGIVTGIGVVEAVECVVVANDPTVRAGTIGPATLEKWLRAMDVSRQNRLPLVHLVESGGLDLPRQAETFVGTGALYRNLTQLSRSDVPTIAVVFGNATAGGAYVPGMSDVTIFVRGAAHVFLGGPPLVKMAIDEDADEEQLGGAEMHATVSGLADFLAVDEHDALRLARIAVARLRWDKLGPGPSMVADEPVHDPDELLGVPSADPRVPYEIREVLARVVDGSRFDEFKRSYGTALVTGWASIHGFPIGVVANNGVLFSEEAHKATQFLQLCNRSDTPLLFVHNITGYMVGTRYERAGIIKHGAQMINAVANSTVPHVALMVGASYGAGNYGMSGRAYDPRFVFSWPSHHIAVMGGDQLAGVMSILARTAAERAGEPFDEELDAAERARVAAQIEREERALYATARLWDDGIVDPRDTRTALGIALSAAHSNVVEGTRRFGVFRP